MSPSQGVVSARRSGRSRTIGVVVAIVVVVLVLSARSIASMVTDLWWFRSLGQSDVWVTRQVVQIVLAVAFSLVFFVLLWANMTIAERLAPAVRPRGTLFPQASRKTARAVNATNSSFGTGNSSTLVSGSSTSRCRRCSP